MSRSPLSCLFAGRFRARGPQGEGRLRLRACTQARLLLDCRATGHGGRMIDTRYALTMARYNAWQNRQLKGDLLRVRLDLKRARDGA